MNKAVILNGQSPMFVPDVVQQGYGGTGMYLPILMVFSQAYGFAAIVARTVIVLSA